MRKRKADLCGYAPRRRNHIILNLPLSEAAPCPLPHRPCRAGHRASATVRKGPGDGAARSARPFAQPHAMRYPCRENGGSRAEGRRDGRFLGAGVSGGAAGAARQSGIVWTGGAPDRCSTVGPLRGLRAAREPRPGRRGERHSLPSRRVQGRQPVPRLRVRRPRRAARDAGGGGRGVRRRRARGHGRLPMGRLAGCQRGGRRSRPAAGAPARPTRKHDR